ncbi:MAG: UDP-N-acetylmuramate dehydrogenase [Chloroflexota bacterium]
MDHKTETTPLHPLRATFGERLQRDVPLARYTAARIGGPADFLLVANTANDLANIAIQMWKLGWPFVVIGSGANILVSDAGVRALVIVNRARQVLLQHGAEPPTVWAESGANLGHLARQTVPLGLSGLEWAAGIPGTVGGAVVGNAGAHDSDTAQSLLMAEILHRSNKKITRERWTPEQLKMGYRTSLLKQNPGKDVVLSALFCLKHSTPEAVQSKIDEFTQKRQRTQPPGASIGSIFKNPADHFAGQLIEAAGLKGTRIGDAEISPLHANFFINHGKASANDIYQLIQLAHQKVLDTSGINLALEVELIGAW